MSFLKIFPKPPKLSKCIPINEFIRNFLLKLVFFPPVLQLKLGTVISYNILKWMDVAKGLHFKDGSLSLRLAIEIFGLDLRI